MTVAELIAKLQALPQDMLVVADRDEFFGYDDMPAPVVKPIMKVDRAAHGCDYQPSEYYDPTHPEEFEAVVVGEALWSISETP